MIQMERCCRANGLLGVKISTTQLVIIPLSIILLLLSGSDSKLLQTHKYYNFIIHRSNNLKFELQGCFLDRNSCKCWSFAKCKSTIWNEVNVAELSWESQLFFPLNPPKLNSATHTNMHYFECIRTKHEKKKN